MSMYVRLTSGRKISGLFEKLKEISGHSVYVQHMVQERSWRPAGAPEKKNAMPFVKTALWDHVWSRLIDVLCHNKSVNSMLERNTTQCVIFIIL